MPYTKTTYSTEVTAANLNKGETAIESVVTTGPDRASVLEDGSAAAPAITFAADTNTGFARLGTDRLGLVTAGVVRAYVQNDGTLIVPDAAAGDPTNLTGGTAPGSIVSGHNRFYRTINAAKTGTVRLLGANTSDEIVIGSGGAEGGPATQIILRNGPETQLFGKVVVHDDAATPAAFITLDPNATYIQLRELANAETFLTARRAGDTFDRMALIESGRAEYGSGAGAADVTVIPRNNAGEWRLALGRMILDDTTGDGGCLEFGERTDVAAPGVNRARLYCRDNGAGKTQVCVRFPTGAVQVIATEP